MKKTILFSVLAALCLFLKAAAQDEPHLKTLWIGDHLPNLTVTNVHDFKAPSLEFAEFKGKAVILDFWATWCAPCVMMIPRMDSLQHKYADRLQFISISTQPAAVIKLFTKRIRQQRKISAPIPSISDDRLLSALFPHQYLPHYVWINAKGTITNITSFEQVNDQTVSAYLNGVDPEQKEMPEISNVVYDKSKPLFIAGNGGEAEQIFAHSILSGFVPGIEVGVTVKVDSLKGIKITARNQSISQLFQTAYGCGWKFAGEKNVIYEVRDTSLLTSGLIGDQYLNWLRSGNSYCYELMMPAGIVESAYPRMRDDLRLYFPQYSAVVEKRKATCMVLKRTSTEDKIKSAGREVAVDIEPIHASIRNGYLNQLTMRLDMMNPSRPVVNETGYKGRVDLEINSSMADFDGINRELARYDLHFDKEEREIEFLVIRDVPSLRSAPVAAKGGEK